MLPEYQKEIASESHGRVLIRQKGTQRKREEFREQTASGFPISLAKVLVASESMGDVSTPSKLTFVDRVRHGMAPGPFLLSAPLRLNSRPNLRHRTMRTTRKQFIEPRGVRIYK